MNRIGWYAKYAEFGPLPPVPGMVCFRLIWKFRFSFTIYVKNGWVCKVCVYPSLPARGMNLANLEI